MLRSIQKIHQRPSGRQGDTWIGVQCLTPDWLLRHVGTGFRLLTFDTDDVLRGVQIVPVTSTSRPDALHDVRGLVAQRYGLSPGACVLLRPDQHVAALFPRLDATRPRAAIDRACAQPMLVQEPA